MNIVWTCIVTVALGIMLIFNVDIAFNGFLTGAQNAISLSLKLWAIYAVWLGILNIVNNTKLDQKIAKILTPITRKLLGKYDKVTEQQISINLTSNFLGMGNASTPSGIKALNGMDDKSGKITAGMITFFILNTTSLQILPTTVIGLRLAAGSENAYSIILPTLFATLTSTVTGVLLCKILEKFKSKKFKPTIFNGRPLCK